MILFVLCILFALALSSFLADFLEMGEPGNAQYTTVFKYFGTFSRALVSIFEISFASHVPAQRALMENVDETYAWFFVGYKCIVGLSVFKVITGVFLHETFKVCSEDDELMIIQKKRQLKKYIRKMQNLFDKVDESGD